MFIKNKKAVIYPDMSKGEIKAKLKKLGLERVKMTIDAYHEKAHPLRKNGIKGGSYGPLTVTTQYLKHNRQVEKEVRDAFIHYLYKPEDIQGNSIYDQYFIPMGNKKYRVVSFVWETFSTYAGRNSNPEYQTMWYVVYIKDVKSSYVSSSNKTALNLKECIEDAGQQHEVSYETLEKIVKEFNEMTELIKNEEFSEGTIEKTRIEEAVSKAQKILEKIRGFKVDIDGLIHECKKVKIQIPYKRKGNNTMDKNTKLAQELLKVAKRLVSGSYEDFIMEYGKEIKDNLREMEKFNKLSEKLSEDQWEELQDEIEKKLRIYDKVVIRTMEDIVSGNASRYDIKDIAELAFNNQMRQGTEVQFTVEALETATRTLEQFLRKNKIH